MARYPSAAWEPVTWMNSMSHSRKTQLTFHITAGEGDPRTIASWKPLAAGGTQKAGSNFVVFRDGRAVQVSDSACRSAADYGATHIISIEFVGAWGPLTDAQVATAIRLCRDANRLDGVPLRLAATSSDSGIGWHRLGVDGNFPSGRYGGRLQRSPLGVLTSGSFGKACPTEPIIDQIHDVILPALTGPEEDDMTPLEMLQAEFGTGRTGPDGKPERVQLWQALQAIYFYGDHLNARLAAVEAAVIASVSKIPGVDPAAVEAAVAEGVKAALESVDTTITFRGEGGGV